jgi:hypothetical protein
LRIAAKNSTRNFLVASISLIQTYIVPLAEKFARPRQFGTAIAFMKGGEWP